MKKYPPTSQRGIAVWMVASGLVPRVVEDRTLRLTGCYLRLDTEDCFVRTLGKILLLRVHKARGQK